MSHTDERNLRIERLGQLLLSVATALENERWDLVITDAMDAAREARALALLDRQEKEEKE